MKVNTTSLGRYNGNTDSWTHFVKYNSYMISVGANDAIMCRLFPLTLGEQVYRWFNSFEQLGKLFISHFAVMAPHPATKKRLVNVEQVVNKSDWAYLKKIDKLIMEGEPLGDEAKILGVVSRLKKSTKPWRHVNSNYPRSYSNFRVRASNIVHTTELLASRLGEVNESAEPKKSRRSGDSTKPLEISKLLKIRSQ